MKQYEKPSIKKVNIKLSHGLTQAIGGGGTKTTATTCTYVDCEFLSPDSCCTTSSTTTTTTSSAIY
jgi:hypothetical protein